MNEHMGPSLLLQAPERGGSHMREGGGEEESQRPVSAQEGQQFFIALDLLCTPEVPVIYDMHRLPACSALHHPQIYSICVTPPGFPK